MVDQQGCEVLKSLFTENAASGVALPEMVTACPHGGDCGNSFS